MHTFSFSTARSKRRADSLNKKLRKQRHAQTRASLTRSKRIVGIIGIVSIIGTVVLTALQVRESLAILADISDAVE